MTRRFRLAVPAAAVLFALSLAGCSASTAPGAVPTAPPADQCAESFFSDTAVEVDPTSIPAVEGATLPLPDCLLYDVGDLGGVPVDSYVAYYLDTSGSIWAEYDAALIAVGFTESEQQEHNWSKFIVDPNDSSASYGITVQGSPGTFGTRDGEALMVTINIPNP